MIVMGSYQVDPAAFAAGFAIGILITVEFQVVAVSVKAIYRFIIYCLDNGFALVKRKFGKEK